MADERTVGQRVADALRVAESAHPGTPCSDPAGILQALAAAGLAVVPREAAEAGEAVLRLPDAMWCISQRQPGRWVVNVYDYDADEDDAPFLSGTGPTLAAAVDAAIQEGADDGR